MQTYNFSMDKTVICIHTFLHKYSRFITGMLRAGYIPPLQMWLRVGGRDTSRPYIGHSINTNKGRFFRPLFDFT